MENNILCFINADLKEEIVFKKIGLKIRNINNEEIKCIKKKIEKLYCSKEQLDLLKRFQKARSVNKKETNTKVIQEAIDTYEEVIEKLDDERRDALFYLEKNAGKFDRSIVRNNLKKCVVVEIDYDKYNKCFELLDVKYVILRIINFANYLGNVSEVNNFKMIPLEIFDDYKTIINNQTYNSFDHLTLKRIASLLNQKNINFNANFIFMIESFLINNISYENKIINMVSLIEKLLLKKEDDKQYCFKLKVGILISREVEWDYDKLSQILKTIYEIRSLLVHGEEDSLYENNFTP